MAVLSKEEQTQLLDALSQLSPSIQRAIFQTTIVQADKCRKKKVPVLKLVSNLSSNCQSAVR